MPTPVSQSARSSHADLSLHTDDENGGHAAGAATALPPGQGAISRSRAGSIEHQQTQLAAHATAAASAVEIELEQLGTTSPALMAQRDVLLRVRGDAAATPIAALTEQFQLEGMAVRAALNNVEADVEALASGRMTRDAVAETLSPSHAVLLERSNVYDALNTGAPNSVEEPFSPAQLGAAGIAGTDRQLDTHRLCLTHDAYLAVRAHLAERPESAAALHDVILAHEAFKVGIAFKENQLEVAQLGLQVGVEMARNKMLLKSQANRVTGLSELEPQLADASGRLAEHARASNYILHAEHIADHQRRAIGGEGPLSTLNKIGQQVLVSGMPQAVSSLVHWGYMRNLGAMLAGQVLADTSGAGTVVASALIQALALGTAHKLVSDGPRDMLQSFAEAGGWAQPPEASNVNQLFPDAPLSRLNAEGRAETIAAPDLLAAQNKVNSDRALFKERSPTFSFGNVDGDNIGQAAFGAANAVRDGVASSGVDGASAIHGRALGSFGGGLVMSSAQGAAQLSKKISLGEEAMALPAYVTAKRPNPRGAVQRLVTGAQKLDLTQEANRLDLYSKVSSAFVGIVLAGTMDAVASAPLHAEQENADKPEAKMAWAVLHALVEGGKSFATLGPFFSGLVAGAEAKAVPGDMGAHAKRRLVGAHNLLDPTRKQTTAAYVPGTFGYKRQVLNNMVKGASQTVAQPMALAAESVISGGIGAVSSGIAAARRVGGGTAAGRAGASDDAV